MSAHPIFKSLESLDTEKDTHDEYSDELLLKIVHTPWPFTLLPEHNSEISLKRETLV